MAGAARAERELRPGSEAWRRTTEVRIPTLTLTLTLTQTLTLTKTLTSCEASIVTLRHAQTPPCFFRPP